MSARGVADVNALAGLAAPLAIAPLLIVHSGKRRAQQTAEIWASAVGPSVEIERQGWLAPEEEPEQAAEFAEGFEGSLMFCGHLPHLNRLVSTLLVGDSEREVYDFPTSGIFALSREYSGWRISWMLTPRMLRAARAEP